MNVKRRTFPLQVKAAPNSDGRFSGYVSIFGTPDSYREVVAPGAFKASLAQTAALGRKIRTLTAVELIEASVVTNPAHDDARVDTIKAKLAAGETLTEREFGKILRERGFSRSDADVIADVGFKAWSRRETANPKANDSGLSDLIQAVGGCKLPQF